MDTYLIVVFDVEFDFENIVCWIIKFKITVIKYAIRFDTFSLYILSNWYAKK